ncbi:MAG: hypothetical protein IPK82_07095 [Polyangiaceae bacterium]|nr:hypothetical protein [Polyangiaceae bacterium]
MPSVPRDVSPVDQIKSLSQKSPFFQHRKRSPADNERAPFALVISRIARYGSLALGAVVFVVMYFSLLAPCHNITKEQAKAAATTLVYA